MRLFNSDRFAEIADTITRNKSRSLLTGFGIFWGVFMLLVMNGGGQGLKEMLSANFEGFATNAGIMATEKTSKPYKGFRKGRVWSFTMKDIARLRAMVPELDVVTPMIGSWNDTFFRGDRKFSGFCQGVEADYCRIQEPKIRYGRFLNEMDVRHERHVCVIGRKVYETLFPEGGDPCGEMILYKNSWYKVVGVDFSLGNINIGGPADESMVVPVSVLRKVMNRGEEVDIICTTMKPGAKFSEVKGKLRQIIYRQHTIAPDDKDAMIEYDAEEIFTMVDNIFKGVNILIWLIGLGTILAGAIGVSNIMMVTVKERTSEIGIRRAIGATPGMILGQNIEESVVLTAIAGLLGIVFSVFVLSLAELAATKDGILTTHFQIGFGTAVMVLLMLTVTGVLAGLAPAARAMAIKPVDAMREK